MISFPANDLSLLESCQPYIIAKYKASNCCKQTSIHSQVFCKKAFLKILQKSQENFVPESIFE